jgi:hypothetical protein
MFPSPAPSYPRPLVGGANVCPGALRLLDEATLTAVVSHEIIHALGFTDAMFNLTRRADGSPRSSSELLSSAVVGGRAVTRVVSPSVAAAAAAHFGCDGLPGAQLEDEGGGGSAGSHWEYLLFQVAGGGGGGGGGRAGRGTDACGA